MVINVVYKINDINWVYGIAVEGSHMRVGVCGCCRGESYEGGCMWWVQRGCMGLL